MKSEKILTGKVTAVLLAVFCCMLWGSAFPCIKIGYRLLDIDGSDSFSQLYFAGLRFTLAGVLTVLIGSVSEKRLLIPRGTEVPKVMLLSLFQTIAQYTFFYLGLARTSGMKSSIITGSNVLFSMILSAFVFRLEKLTLTKLTGCILGFAGVVLVNFQSGGDLSFRLTGEGFILFSAMSYGVSSCLTKRFAKDSDPVLMSGWQFIFGGAVMTVIGIAFGGRLGSVNIKGVLMLLWLAFVSAAAFSVWSLLLKHNPVSKISVYGFTNPIFGALLSLILLGESETVSLERASVSLVLVAVGIIIVNKPRKKPNFLKTP